MNTARMHLRVPAAKVKGRAQLLNQRFVYNKRSLDGSAKANLRDSLGDSVWGVLYEIDTGDLEHLDQVEGGYERREMEVWTYDARPQIAHVYVSNELTNALLPYDSYRDFILEGAREHELPHDYVDSLAKFPSKPDSTYYTDPL